MTVLNKHLAVRNEEIATVQPSTTPMAPPPPSDHPAFHLRLLEHPFQVLQLKTNEKIPEEYLKLVSDASASRFVSLTRTEEEVSIVLESDEENEAATWRCIKIAGSMDFGGW